MSSSCKSAWRGLLALPLVVAPSAARQVDAFPVLDPRTYASPSGEFVLRVDPSDRLGAGEGSYRFTHSGVELWSGTRPYTFWRAEVADDGTVAGYAFAAGILGGREDSLTLVVLDAWGVARLQDALPRDGITSCLSGPEPSVLGLLLDRPNDRLVLRLGLERGTSERWRLYSLSSASFLRGITPEIDRGAPSRSVQVVPGTPLVLVHDFVADERRERIGATFLLLDADGRRVWSETWPEDYCTSDPEAESTLLAEMRERGAILGTEAPGRFTVLHASRSERVTFEATRARSGAAWRVHELARAPFLGGLQPEPGPALESFPAVELRSTGRIVLPAGALPPGTNRPGVDDESALGEIDRLELGLDDRIYAVDHRTGAVHVFDPDGRLDHVCRPAPADVVRVYLSSLAVTPAGEVLLRADHGKDSFLHFSAEGRLLGLRWLDLDPFPRHQEWSFQPGTDDTVVLEPDELHLVAPDGTLLRTITRAPDEAWLRELRQVVVAPDGSFAVSRGFHESAVHLFSSRGDPVRTVDLPRDSTAWLWFAYDAERLAVGTYARKDAAASAVVLDMRGRGSFRFTPARPAESWQPFFAARGTELWLFDGERTIERYALP